MSAGGGCVASNGGERTGDTSRIPESGPITASANERTVSDAAGGA
jgi:hypothetical protein